MILIREKKRLLLVCRILIEVQKCGLWSCRKYYAELARNVSRLIQTKGGNENEFFEAVYIIDI